MERTVWEIKLLVVLEREEHSLLLDSHESTLLFRFQHSCSQFICSTFWLFLIREMLPEWIAVKQRETGQIRSVLRCMNVKEVKLEFGGSCELRSVGRIVWSKDRGDAQIALFLSAFLKANDYNSAKLQASERFSEIVWKDLICRYWEAVTNAFLLFRQPLELISCRKQCILKIAR